VGPAKTEIGISGKYRYVHFPIPKLFAEFGIEVILQRMAARIREQLEDRHSVERHTSDEKK
jgi:hypothetical protein